MKLPSENRDLRAAPWGFHLLSTRKSNHAGTLMQDETSRTSCPEAPGTREIQQGRDLCQHQSWLPKSRVEWGQSRCCWDEQVTCKESLKETGATGVTLQGLQRNTYGAEITSGLNLCKISQKLLWSSVIVLWQGHGHSWMFQPFCPRTSRLVQAYEICAFWQSFLFSFPAWFKTKTTCFTPATPFGWHAGITCLLLEMFKESTLLSCAFIMCFS